MDELLKVLPNGYNAPVWLITIAIAMRLLSIDKVVVAVYADIVKPFFHRRNEQLANNVSDTTVNDLIYSKYLSVARHLITTAWQVLLELRNGQVAGEAVQDRLRTRSSDSIENAKQGLGIYKSIRTGKRLNEHLCSLTTSRKNEFYAPIVFEILEGCSDENLAFRYENLRMIILRETDQLTSEGIDEILKERTKQ